MNRQFVFNIILDKHSIIGCHVLENEGIRIASETEESYCLVLAIEFIQSKYKFTYLKAFFM